MNHERADDSNPEDQKAHYSLRTQSPERRHSPAPKAQSPRLDGSRVPAPCAPRESEPDGDRRESAPGPKAPLVGAHRRLTAIGECRQFLPPDDASSGQAKAYLHPVSSCHFASSERPPLGPPSTA